MGTHGGRAEMQPCCGRKLALRDAAFWARRGGRKFGSALGRILQGCSSAGRAGAGERLSSVLKHTRRGPQHAQGPARATRAGQRPCIESPKAPYCAARRRSSRNAPASSDHAQLAPSRCHGWPARRRRRRRVVCGGTAPCCVSAPAQQRCRQLPLLPSFDGRAVPAVAHGGFVHFQPPAFQSVRA